MRRLHVVVRHVVVRHVSSGECLPAERLPPKQFVKPLPIGYAKAVSDLWAPFDSGLPNGPQTLAEKSAHSPVCDVLVL